MHCNSARPRPNQLLQRLSGKTCTRVHEPNDWGETGREKDKAWWSKCFCNTSQWHFSGLLVTPGSTTCFTSFSRWWSLRWLLSFSLMRPSCFGDTCTSFDIFTLQQLCEVVAISEAVAAFFWQVLKKLSAAKSMKSFTVYQAPQVLRGGKCPKQAELCAAMQCDAVRCGTVLSWHMAFSLFVRFAKLVLLWVSQNLYVHYTIHVTKADTKVGNERKWRLNGGTQYIMYISVSPFNSFNDQFLHFEVDQSLQNFRRMTKAPLDREAMCARPQSHVEIVWWHCISMHLHSIHLHANTHLCVEAMMLGYALLFFTWFWEVSSL